MKELSIEKIFSDYARDILLAREKAITLHHTSDIKAAGNEVEQSIRDFFTRVLPQKYYVTHGHLIDVKGVVSPQIDLIISDNTTLPSFIKTKDGTEYIPIDSVYAIAEIKSSYNKYDKQIEEFSKKLRFIRTQMNHPLVLNTAFDGVIHDDLDFGQLDLCNYNKFLNRIFSFMFFVNRGDFKFKDVKNIFSSSPKEELPDMSVILDTGFISYTYLDSTHLEFHRYPEQHTENTNKWRFAPFNKSSDEDSIEGNVLGFIYSTLLSHLSQSKLEPPTLSGYTQRMFKVKKSGIETE